MNGVTSQAGRPGRLVSWEDEKGFGWVETEGVRIFAHIKEFERGQPRPVASDEVTFRIGVDAQGRTRAKGIRLSRKMARTTGRIGFGSWVLLAGLLVLPLFSGEYLPVPRWVVPGVMTVASAVAWFCYRRDKQCAEAGQWRIPEAQLHLVELSGGWPGAFLAQRKFRHKTQKLSFKIVFVMIVALHQVVAVDVILGHALSRWVWREMKRMPGIWSEM